MKLCFLLCFWISTVLRRLPNTGVISEPPNAAPTSTFTPVLGVLCARNQGSLPISFWFLVVNHHFLREHFCDLPDNRGYILFISVCPDSSNQDRRMKNVRYKCVIETHGWVSGQITTLVWNLRGLISRYSFLPLAGHRFAGFCNLLEKVVQCHPKTDGSKPHAFSERYS